MEVLIKMKKRKKKRNLSADPKTYQKYFRMIEKIKKFLEEEDYRLKFKNLKDENAEGKTTEDDTILIDPQTNLLSTFIHEVLHEIYPDLKEEEILEKEKFIFEHLTPTHAKQLVLVISKLLNY